MVRLVFGEWSAITGTKGIRYQKNGKLTSESAVPPEVVAYFKSKLARPADILKAPPTVPQPAEIEDNVDHITPDDFSEPAPEPVTEVTPPFPQSFAPVETISTAPELLPEVEAQVDVNFLETVSIYTASLDDIAQALYDRFGIYTAYLKKLPQIDEINPLTATSFTKYHLGIAYQAAIFAQQNGLLNRDQSMQRTAIDEGRKASETFHVDPVAYNASDARQTNSFAFRTSVKGNQAQPTTRIQHVQDPDGTVRAVQVAIPAEELDPGNGAGKRYSADDEEFLVEPPIMGGQPIIRPNW